MSDSVTPFAEQVQDEGDDTEILTFVVYSKMVTVENEKIVVPDPDPTPTDPGPGPGPGPGPQNPVRPDPPTTEVADEIVPLAEPEEIADEPVPLAEVEEEIVDEVVPLAAVPKTGIGYTDYSQVISANYLIAIEAIEDDKRKKRR